MKWHIVMVSDKGNIFDFYSNNSTKGGAMEEANREIINNKMTKEGYRIQVVMEKDLND